MKPKMRSAAIYVAGLSAVILLIALFQQFGLAKPSSPQGTNVYPLSQLIENSITTSFLIAYVLTSAFSGLLGARPVTFAFGMMSPLPIADLLELYWNSTTHNLLGIEMLILWIPAFFLALLTAYFGNWLRQKFTTK